MLFYKLQKSIRHEGGCFSNSNSIFYNIADVFAAHFACVDSVPKGDCPRTVGKNVPHSKEFFPAYRIQKNESVYPDISDLLLAKLASYHFPIPLISIYWNYYTSKNWVCQ